MSYAVKEIYFTLQGEGVNTGRAAVFLRFAGCNLWSGRDADRSRGSAACAAWCDTDFTGTDGPGGGRFADAVALARAVAQTWPPASSAPRLVVCTGGEPLLQLDGPLVDALHAERFTVAIETNGTRTPPPGVDWICVSPKAGAELVLTRGDELKLIFPQPGAEPERFASLEFRHFLLQPLDDSAREENTRRAVEYCLEHPEWRLSLQTHKRLGLR
ncbi:MAG: 7-carboxy-7-deazaguanine synthase [Deltaproteobacteria bacterium]|nr:7-carboxy-7-deazaguanine synthase [Deltaproteobacteria bacterium]